MSVKDQRAAAAAAGQSMSDWKNSNSNQSTARSKASSYQPNKQVRPSPKPGKQVRPSPKPSRPSPGRVPTPQQVANMSVKDRREAAKAAGMSMAQFKGNEPRPNPNIPNQSQNNAGMNANNADMLTTNQATPGRLSSEGLYQDRYNVGYTGEKDQGDEYASNAYYGSIKDAFKGAIFGKNLRPGETKDQAFARELDWFTGSGNDDGYAGDILKLIDSGYFNVSDENYNKAVEAAEGYDWDNRLEVAGRDAHGGGTYDSRVGGVAGNHVAAMDEWNYNMDTYGQPKAPGQHGYVEPDQSNDYEHISNDYGSPRPTDPNGYFTDVRSPSPSPAPKQNYDPFAARAGRQVGVKGVEQSNPFMNFSNPFGNFKFDPKRFNQGQ